MIQPRELVAKPAIFAEENIGGGGANVEQLFNRRPSPSPSPSPSPTNLCLGRYYNIFGTSHEKTNNDGKKRLLLTASAAA